MLTAVRPNGSCFAYGPEVQILARQGIYRFDNENFQVTYIQKYPYIYADQNIRSEYLAAGLVPYDPQRVLVHLQSLRHPLR